VIMPLKTFKDTFLKMDANIVDALRVIDQAAMQIVLIVDADEKLLGTITDGDIRRAILAGKTLNTSVTEVMNKSPVTLGENTLGEDVLSLMAEKKVHQIPVVNIEGKVLDLKNISQVVIDSNGRVSNIQKRSLSVDKTKVFLMLGGEGKRLRPLTEKTPKPMLPVGGKPLLETIVSNFVDQGFEEFYFSINYKADVIKNFFGDGEKVGAKISYIDEVNKMGTAGSLGLLPERIEAPMIVMNGDLLTNVNFANVLDFHSQNSALATMCVREYVYNIPYGIVENDGVQLSSIIEKPAQSHFINAGIYVLEPEVLSLIPQNQYFDMPQLFEKIRETGGAAGVFPIHEYWRDIGKVEDLERARAEYESVFVR